jgi:diguanylate cyclase (GGDEF)-like protein/PAS domain S-box-containing protein
VGLFTSYVEGVFSEVAPSSQPSLQWAQGASGVGLAAGVECSLTVNNAQQEHGVNDDHYKDAHWSQVLGRALEAVSNGITITDPHQPDNPIVYANPAFERITGYSAEEAIGRNCRFLQGADRDQPPLEEVRTAIREEREGRVVVRNYRKDGTLFWQELRISPVRDEQGRLTHFVGVHDDVTERKLADDRLAHQALHDSLTGLPNRTLFLDRLRHALARIERHGGQLAVLFMDLDDFKIINDSLGHEAGDRLLASVAERLSSHLRLEDTVARLSGDEFAVVLENIARYEAVRLAERIAEVLRDPFVLDGREVFVTASIGIVLGGATTSTDAQELLRRADLTMYRAKHSGKARHAVYEEEMNAEVLRRLETRTQLRRAVEREEFVVHYQPLLELVTGKPLLTEALVRWEHPHQGLVRPGTFLPVAEETGLIVPMGGWLLQEACRQTKRWQDLYPSEPPLGVSVNLSLRELERPNIIEDVAETLRDTELEASSLTLEINESVAVDKTPWVVNVLKEIKDLGVRLAIDDFGTGYSSISYLQNLPADFLKLDMSLVSQLSQNVRSWKFVMGTITLARFLGVKTVAEGVETTDQLERLRRYKCDLVQGYYFCEPLPSEAASAFIATHL